MTKPLHHPLPEAPEGAVLVRLAKSVDADPSQPPSPAPSKARENRAELFSRQRLAASILGRERVGKCLWSVADLSSQIAVKRRNNAARFEGLQTCGSVWHCPVCSARISEVRRVELNKALAQARSMGVAVMLVTLTVRHSASDALPELLAALKAAKQHWHDSRTYKRHKPNIRGCITATELTHGTNGWHPHFHLLLFIGGPLGIVGLSRIESELRDQWLASLQARGLSGNGAAFDWQGADKAGQYVAKWGAAEEMTLTAKKGGADGGKTKGRHPYQILADSAYSPRDKHLFYTYAQAFKGRRQLQWTPGLRDLLAVPETTDQQAAVIEPSNEDEWLASISSGDWKVVRVKGRAHILERCEDAADQPLQPILDAVMAGPDVEA